jgi:hypothetical protein
MLFIFLFSFLERTVIINSSSAERLASPQRRNTVAVIPNTQYQKGKQLNAIPQYYLRKH